MANARRKGGLMKALPIHGPFTALAFVGGAWRPRRVRALRVEPDHGISAVRANVTVR